MICRSELPPPIRVRDLPRPAPALDDHMSFTDWLHVGLVVGVAAIFFFASIFLVGAFCMGVEG